MSTPHSRKALVIKLGPSPSLNREIHIYKELGASAVGGPASIPQILWSGEELGYQGIIMPKYLDNLCTLRQPTPKLKKAELFVYVSICVVDMVCFQI